jgi:hypothetical protein
MDPCPPPPLSYNSFEEPGREPGLKLQPGYSPWNTGWLRRLLGFEPQLLKQIVHIKIDPFRTNLISLQLSEGSSTHCDGAASSRGAVWQRAGVGAVEHPLGGDQAASSVNGTDRLQRRVGIGRANRFDNVKRELSESTPAGISG